MTIWVFPRVRIFVRVARRCLDSKKVPVTGLAALAAPLLVYGISTGSTLAAGCPAPTFGAPSTSPVGAHPIAVAVGDFNGDG